LQSEPIIFSGSASKQLTQDICNFLKLPKGNLETTHFSDEETWVKINENVRGADVFVVQSTCTPVNDNLMELLLIIDALRRASAQRVNAVIPYFGYARQDRKDQGRVALSAKLVANLITTAGAERVLTVDLHSGQIQGFFDIPVDHLLAAPLLVDYVKKLNLENYVVVSPDVGNVKRARGYAERLDAPLVIIDKRRPRPNVSEVMNIIGEIVGRNVFIFDDMIDTAGTIVNAARALKEKGARDVYACCTHPILSGDALKRIAESPLKEAIVTDTIPVNNKKPIDKIHVVSVAPLFGEAIRRIHNHQSVSALFS
jgi:ribose-phosphate pyrophosphokinase